MCTARFSIQRCVRAGQPALLRAEARTAQLARIRDEFEKHRGETNPVVIEGLLSRGEKKLDEYSHPDPYTGACARSRSPRRTCSLPSTVPYKYGGSKYARNPPVPPEIHAVMDYNRDYPPSEHALAAAAAHAPAAAHH